MTESYAIETQTLQPGQAMIFYTVDPCRRGLVRHREGTSDFLLAGASGPNYGCGCGASRSVEYFVDFHANIAVPEGGAAGEVQLAFAIDGTVLPVSVMRATPAAAEQFFNVGRSTNVPIWRNCCQTLTVVNSGTTPVAVQEGNIVIDYRG